MNPCEQIRAQGVPDRWHDAEASRLRIAVLEAALRSIIGHWWEFGEMMLTHQTDYGLSERMDAAAKLVAQESNN